MKISRVRAVPLSAPVPKERQWRTDFGTKVKSDTTIVVVETDEGITGYGCAQGSPPVMVATVEGVPSTISTCSWLAPSGICSRAPSGMM